MKIGIMGIGGIGGFYGGKLARHYETSTEHDVFFIARGKHLEKIRAQGLSVHTKDETFIARPADATDNPEELGLLDLVIFCVKGYGLETAARNILPTIHDSTVIIPLLNGVDNAERLAGVLSKGRVLNGTVYISSHIVEPGSIEQVGGSCKLFFGPKDGNTAPYEPLEKLLVDAGVNAVLSKNIELDVWTKYIFIGPVAGMTAMTGKTLGALMETPRDRIMLEGMMKEVEAVARRQNIAFPANIVETSLAMTSNFPYETKTSFQLDFEKGSEAEIDTFIGYIVKTGGKLNIGTPLHADAYSELRRRQA